MPLNYSNSVTLLQDLNLILEAESEDAKLNPYLRPIFSKFLSNADIFNLASNIDLINLISAIFWKIADGLEAKDPWSNAVDPLTFMLGAAYTESDSLMSYSITETQRQKEKSIGNHFGYFSQGLMRLAFNDPRLLDDLYENKSTRFDVESHNSEIALEVKSKWNTTKGDSRAGKYKDLWKIKGSFNELYFVEILCKPGHNFNPEHNLIDSVNWPNFWRCNGEFIFRRAAVFKGLEIKGSYLKDLYNNFAGILWVYLSLHELNQHELNEVSSLISEFQTQAQERLSTGSFKSTEQQEMLNIFTRISTEQGSEELFNHQSRVLPVERKRAKDYVLLENKLNNLNNFTAAIKSSIEKFTSDKNDLEYLTTRLIGHL